MKIRKRKQIRTDVFEEILTNQYWYIQPIDLRNYLMQWVDQDFIIEVRSRLLAISCIPDLSCDPPAQPPT